MKGQPWTEAEIRFAISVLKASRTVASALRVINEKLGRTLGQSNLTGVFRARGLDPMSFIPHPSEPLAQMPEAPPPPEPRALPDWRETMPAGQRLRGNSTLVDAHGNVDRKWVKTERDSDDASEFDLVPDGHHVRGVSTLVDGQGNVRSQWITTRHDQIAREAAFWEACAVHVAEYKGIAKAVRAPKCTDSDTCTVYPLGDPHIGMMAWSQETGQDFDLKIAERDLIATVHRLVASAPNSELAVLANVGDFFHADDNTQLTPASKHKLDVDSRAAKVFRLGCTMMRTLIDLLLTKHARVDVRNVPGNHDPTTSRMLAMWLEAVYEREPRVTITPNLNPFSYLEFGRNLFGFTHGDGCKPADLPGVMASDQAESWGRTDFRLWFTGHIHHETCKEFHGCTVESFRTLASRDYWHHSKGYRTGRSLSAITFHRDYGEISRSTVDLRLARAA
jgi:hypothetical protein